MNTNCIFQAKNFSEKSGIQLFVANLLNVWPHRRQLGSRSCSSLQLVTVISCSGQRVCRKSGLTQEVAGMGESIPIASPDN